MTASFPEASAAISVISAWRLNGTKAAMSALESVLSSLYDRGLPPGALLLELQARLDGRPGPRLLIDGLWFNRPYGGITRVWEQILSTWQLPGFLSDDAPVGIINRGSHLSLIDSFPSFKAKSINPLDPQAIASIADENGDFVRSWRADVFCSSWISSSGLLSPSCPELALVHDCLPERSKDRRSHLLKTRRRWLRGASAYLAVSAATADDLFQLLSLSSNSIAWCHLAPAPVFASIDAYEGAEQLWYQLRHQAFLNDPFVLLPATSVIGSYKNPELLAEALSCSSLSGINLVLCGLAAEQRAQELKTYFPFLAPSIYAAGFTDVELALVYRHALAVVIPSRIEGFGLPAIEVMAAGGLPLLADSRGLREAGGEGALRFPVDQPRVLSALLELLLDPSCRSWIQSCLALRVRRRLARLHPDLIGLALLAQARLCQTNGVF